MGNANSFPFEEDIETSSHKSLRLVDLNYYCLKEIFKLLDPSSQFAVMRTCKLFKHIIVDDIWLRYHKTGFNFKNAPEMTLRTLEFQSDVLKFFLQNFKQVNNVPLNVLNRCFKDNKNKTFNKIGYLSIVDKRNGHHILDTNNLSRFPNLVSLGLDQMTIQGRKYSFPDVVELFMNNIHMRDCRLIENIFTPNIRSLFLMSLPFGTINGGNVCCLIKGDNLRQLSISSEYIHNRYVLRRVLYLPSLEILTLDTRRSKELEIPYSSFFKRILKKIHKNPTKTLEGIQINGVPDKSIFSSRYLNGIQKLNWMVNGKSRCIPSGARPDDLPRVILAFTKLIENNRHLETLYARDNLFCRVQLSRKSKLLHHLERTREKKDYPRLNIVTCYKDLPNNPYIVDLMENSIRYIFKRNE